MLTPKPYSTLVPPSLHSIEARVPELRLELARSVTEVSVLETSLRLFLSELCWPAQLLRDSHVPPALKHDLNARYW